MADNKETIFIYINGYAAMYIDSQDIKAFLNEKLKTDKWISCDNDIRFLPSELGPVINNNFMHGISATQIKQVEKGGIFINPYILGLSSDFELWSTFLVNNFNFNRSILFIDIPYDLYENASKNNWKVEKEEYEGNNIATKKMVHALNEDLNGAIVYH